MDSDISSKLNQYYEALKTNDSSLKSSLKIEILEFLSKNDNLKTFFDTLNYSNQQINKELLIVLIDFKNYNKDLTNLTFILYNFVDHIDNSFFKLFADKLNEYYKALKNNNEEELKLDIDLDLHLDNILKYINNFQYYYGIDIKNILELFKEEQNKTLENLKKIMKSYKEYNEITKILFETNNNINQELFNKLNDIDFLLKYLYINKKMIMVKDLD